MDEDYLKHIDRLIQQRPVARPALESYRELARLMVHAEPSPKVKRPEPACSEIGKNEGFPAFQRQFSQNDRFAVSYRAQIRVMVPVLM